MVDDFIIPLGMRCNSAGVIRYQLKYNQPAMVFDWIQLSLKTMLEIIELEKSQVKEYFDDYFSDPFVNCRHPERNDWLPHDFEPNFKLDDIKYQYIRRTNRFIDYLELDQLKTFLITFSLKPDSENIDCFEKIKSKVCKRIDNNYLFLTVNCGLENIEVDNHKNLIVEVDNWKDYDIEIKNWIKDLRK